MKVSPRIYAWLLNNLIVYLHEAVDLIRKSYNPRTYEERRLVETMRIDLLSFKIFDLFRCKISCKREVILGIYDLLMAEDKESCKIFRIKNRLSQGTRDILINLSMDQKYMCEIQLSIGQKDSGEQKCYDAFNHFLYELKRAKLGSLPEMGSIWALND